MSSSFFPVVVFALVVWPVVCYAVRAATEKLFGDRPNAVPTSDALTWFMSTAVLAAAAHARWSEGRPNPDMEYAYVGMILTQVFFQQSGDVVDRERVGLVAILYLCVVYAQSEHLLLPYSVSYAFFRSIHLLIPSVVDMPSGMQQGLCTFETAFLATMCCWWVWTTGTFNPVVFSINAVTAWGHQLPDFVRRR